MGKKLLTTMIVLFAASTIGLGTLGYKAAVSSFKDLQTLNEYDWVMDLTSEYSLIENAGLDGNYFSAQINEDKAFLIDEHGKKIDEVDYGWIEGSGSAYIYTEGGKMGYKDLAGRIIIPARYDYTNRFDGEYAEAFTGNRHFAVDKKGREVYRTDDDEDIFFNQIHGKYFGEQKGEKYRVIDVSTGKTIKEWNVAYCSEIRFMMPGLYQANGICGYYFLDENFDVAFDDKVYDFGVVRDFSDGLCYVEQITDGTYIDTPANPSTKPGYIDDQGEMVIETKGAMYGGDFSEGKALIYGAKKAWAIDRTGKKLFSVKLKKNLAVSGADPTEPFQLYVYILNGSIFQNGMVPIYDGRKMGLADQNGKWILNPVFDDMDFVADHLVAVEYNGRWGIIRV